VTNGNVDPNAAITQSKLSLQLAKTMAAKPSNSAVNAGSFVPGKTYVITALGANNWNTNAGTSGVTYNVGSIFTATTAGTANSGGTATENIQANSGVASFHSTHFSIDSGFVSIADSGISLGKLATLANGYLIGNNSGTDTNPAGITFAGALNSALTNPAVGVVIRSSATSFSTVGYAMANTDGALVQRDSDGGGIKVGSITAGGQVKGSSFSTEGAISCGAISSTSSLSIKEIIHHCCVYYKILPKWIYKKHKIICINRKTNKIIITINKKNKNFKDRTKISANINKIKRLVK
jgi:hypothetical protein